MPSARDSISLARLSWLRRSFFTSLSEICIATPTLAQFFQTGNPAVSLMRSLALETRGFARLGSPPSCLFLPDALRPICYSALSQDSLGSFAGISHFFAIWSVLPSLALPKASLVPSWGRRPEYVKYRHPSPE